MVPFETLNSHYRGFCMKISSAFFAFSMQCHQWKLGHTQCLLHGHFCAPQSWFAPLFQIRPSFAFDKSSLRLTEPCCHSNHYHHLLPHGCHCLQTNGLQRFVQLRLLQFVSDALDSKHNILFVYLFVLFVCLWLRVSPLDCRDFLGFAYCN